MFEAVDAQSAGLVNAVREVQELHVFLDGWLKGDVPRSETAFARFADALADDFVIVYPSGNTGDKPGSLRGFWNAHGNMGTEYALQIVDAHVITATDDLAVVGYIEHHQGSAMPSRRATAVLRRTASGRLSWVHLQETLLPAR